MFSMESILAPMGTSRKLSSERAIAVTLAYTLPKDGRGRGGREGRGEGGREEVNAGKGEESRHWLVTEIRFNSVCMCVHESGVVGASLCGVCF